MLSRLANGLAWLAVHPRGLLRLLVVLALSAVISAPPRPFVVLGPQQQVHTINGKMGIHTRLTDEVEPWKIKRSLQMVREMGAPWIVEYFPWAYSEPQPGRYDWTHADLVVNHARRQGLTVVARLGLVPEWARPKDTTNTYLEEERFPDFARFVGQFVRHFQGRVSYIIIWNEPNLSLEWGYRPVDPDGYVRLLRLSYQAAKKSDPGVRVLAGALAPTLAPPGSAEGMNDLVFLQRMYDAGARAHFDILALHAYGWSFPPDEPAAPDAINFARVELAREIMVRNGDGDKVAMITEGGWNDHPRWTKAVRPAQRIAYTVRAYEKVATEWPWCQAVALWAFRYPWATRTYQDYFTFVTPDFTAKLIYAEVQGYAQGRRQTVDRQDAGHAQ
ncbi:MAG: beta-galactosidase [Anaerolineae bacterium]|nr:beta-galactosidase [Anaerolineae bacterium]